MADKKLIDAVLQNDQGAAEAALAAGANPNVDIPGKYRGTRRLLHVITDAYDPEGYGDRAKLAALLLEHGADGDAPDSNHETPLFTALHHAADPVVRALVDGGADIKAVTHRWKNPMMTIAAQAGIFWLVKRCLSVGVDVNVRDSQENTPLHGVHDQLMIIGGRFNIEISQLLINAGAAINAKNNKGRSALHNACMWPKTFDGVELLLDNGAAVDAADKLGNQPLHYASEWGTDALIRLLVKRGAKLEAKNEQGLTPLLFAISEQGFNAYPLEVLLDVGASAKAKSKKGQSVFSFWIAKNNRFAALEPKELALVRTFLKKGAPASAVNASATGLLHRLAKGDCAALIKEAVRKGAPLDAPAKDGWSPLHYAATHASPHTAKALLDAGADSKVSSTKARKLRRKEFPKGSRPKDVARTLGNTLTASIL